MMLIDEQRNLLYLASDEAHSWLNQQSRETAARTLTHDQRPRVTALRIRSTPDVLVYCDSLWYPYQPEPPSRLRTPCRT